MTSSDVEKTAYDGKHDPIVTSEENEVEPAAGQHSHRLQIITRH
jgi:hypothetical protein